MVRRKVNRKEVHIMAEITLKLSVTKVETTGTHYIIYWELEGPPNEWYQIWYRTIPKDQEFIDYLGWIKGKEGNFDNDGIATGIRMLDRGTHTEHKVEMMTRGENEVFSNRVKLKPLEPSSDAPKEEPLSPWECTYCGKRFDTQGEQTEHVRAVHTYNISGGEEADAINALANGLSYDNYFAKAALLSGQTAADVRKRIEKGKPDVFSTIRLGTGKKPEDVYKTCNDKALEAQHKYMAMVGVATALEALPYVDIGSTTLQLMNTPIWSAGNRMATDFYYSGFRYGTEPMLQRYWFKGNTPLLPESYRLALGASRGLITDTIYKEAMAQSGLNAEWADMWLKQNYEYPNFAQIAQLYWRKTIDDKIYNNYMQLAGYDKERATKLKELTKIIPPLTDLITMAVREAFGKHTYEEQMPALVEWGAKQGLSEEWVKNYWYSHWDRIPLTQMYSNLWRGFWTADEFDRMLRIKDVHPDDRKAIIAVAYNPPSVREMGYGYDFGRYKREDLIRYKKMVGLTPEDAEKAADALIDYRTSAEWEAIRREFLWMFAHEEITEEEYLTFLKFTGLQDNIIELWLSRGQLQLERFKVPETAVEYRIVTSSEALWAFKNDLRQETWLRGTLSNLGWAQERVDVAVERALYEKAMKEDIPDIIQPRTLTISQLKSLYQAQLISLDALIDRLQLELHYTLEDATMLAKTFVITPEELEPEITTRKLTLAQLKQMYEAHMLDSSQLVVELVENLNYDIDDAYALVYLYTPELEPEVVEPEVGVTFKKPYSDAWSRRLFSQRLFIPLEVYNNYKNLGYSSVQADTLTISMLIDDIYPMLIAQYRKGMINEEYLLKELVFIGMNITEAIELLEKTIRDFQVDRLDDERKLTKSEIIKGFKAQVLTTNQTVELLTDIGYEYWEAVYIINLELVTAKGDPETFWEMKKVTESYKRALNRNSKSIPEEVLMLDKEVKKLGKELKELEDTNANEATVAKKVGEVSQVKARLRKVLVLKKLRE